MGTNDNNPALARHQTSQKHDLKQRRVTKREWVMLERFIRKESLQGWGYLADFLGSVIFQIFHFAKIHVIYWISRWYLTGVTAAQLRWHLSNMNAI